MIISEKYLGENYIVIFFEKKKYKNLSQGD